MTHKLNPPEKLKLKTLKKKHQEMKGNPKSTQDKLKCRKKS